MHISLGLGGVVPQTDSADFGTLPTWLQMFAHIDISATVQSLFELSQTRRSEPRL
jgi:hypothetical protein